jgi:hypothetical protein
MRLPADDLGEGSEAGLAASGFPFLLTHLSVLSKGPGARIAHPCRAVTRPQRLHWAFWTLPPDPKPKVASVTRKSWIPSRQRRRPRIFGKWGLPSRARRFPLESQSAPQLQQEGQDDQPDQDSPIGTGDHLQFPPSIVNPSTLKYNPASEKYTRESKDHSRLSVRTGRYSSEEEPISSQRLRVGRKRTARTLEDPTRARRGDDDDDTYHGRQRAILSRKERIKRLTLKRRKKENLHAVA